MDSTQLSLDQEFERYIEILKEKQEEAKAKQPRETMLSMYALAKQGSYGETGFKAEPEPGFFDIVGKMKYNAWKEIHTMH